MVKHRTKSVNLDQKIIRCIRKTILNPESTTQAGTTEQPATVDPDSVTSSEFCEALDFVIDNSWTRGQMSVAFSENVITGDYTALDHVEIGFDGPVEWISVYFPFDQSKTVDLGNNVFRLFFLPEFEGFRRRFFRERGRVCVR